jgi:hypothetical protein
MKTSRPCTGTISTAIAVSSLVLLSISTQAQDARWAVELRPGANLATQQLAGVDIKPGFGAEATIAYRFMEHLGIYAGWGWNQFTPDIENAGHYEETGYTFGLRFQHPINDKLDYMISVGSVYNHLELEDTDGNLYGDTGHGFGWQAEAGVAIPLGERWRLTPGIRYRSLSRDLTVGEQTTQLDLTYLSLGVGVAITF